MRKMHKIIALALGSVIGLAAFAACGERGDEPQAPINSTGDAQNYKIVYDNLDDGITLDASVTQQAVADAKVVAAYDDKGNTVEDWTKIVTYENGVFTAVSEGRVRYQLADGKTGNVEVVAAYPTEPDHAYAGNAQDFAESGDQGESVLGHTHDPSIIEVRNWRGESIYYMFSTGWADTSAYGDKTTYGNAIHISYDGMLTWEFLGRTFDYATRDTEFINTKAGEWLYDKSVTNTSLTSAASWWAPDVVAKADGSGYWLYTCVVDGGDGVTVNGKNYSRSCILLYESTSLEPGSFKPVTKDGQPVVLAQSSLNNGPSDPGSVNAIDPQIITTPDGKMYMAYGSFGSGNYILEIDPATGLRKDGQNGWTTHEILDGYRAEVSAEFNKSPTAVGWEHPYYGKNIGKSAMEAPVIARHDNVQMMDEYGEALEGSGETYYYTMHSYDGLSDNYQLWGGKSASVLGLYTSATGKGVVWNANSGYPAKVNANTQGNKYMGSFLWTNRADSDPELDAMLPGHNDLFTMNNGTSVTAYITRAAGMTGNFTTQIHQYYLNSYGDICINPNRYAGESSRPVSAEELFKYTKNVDGSTDKFLFEMVVMTNADRDNVSANGSTTSANIDAGSLYANNLSRTVVLTRNAADGNTGDIYEKDGTTKLGTWKMYGNGYIAFHFDKTLKGLNIKGAALDSGEKDYYGVVRTAWLNDQNRSGFTITCLSRTGESVRSLSMFMNNYSTITGDGLVGTQYTDEAEE